MKLVGLLSGGKDSCFNLIKCIESGHEVVCLANLCPPSTSSSSSSSATTSTIDDQCPSEEMHSYMYQTAGASIIEQQAQCFNLPVVKREIRGSAVNQAMEYKGAVAGDEVEDLYLLLLDVLMRYPDVKGVSCGAILSNYQRNRLENVCSRLGLTAVCLMWQQPRSELLDEMLSPCNEMDVVLVKVAGAGLDPYKHLGKSLKNMRNQLNLLNSQFGLDICGEGGEYESFVLDCRLFKTHRLVISKSRIEVDEENNTVGNLIMTCKIIEKEQKKESLSRDLLPSPTGGGKYKINEEEAAVVSIVDCTLGESNHVTEAAITPPRPREEELSAERDSNDFGYYLNFDHSDSEFSDCNYGYSGGHNSFFDFEQNIGGGFGDSRFVRMSIGLDGLIQTQSISGVDIGSEGIIDVVAAAASGSDSTATDPLSSMDNQVSRIFAKLNASLDALSVDSTNILIVHIYISSMGLFAAMNQAYLKHVTNDHPPSRICVSAALPHPQLVAMDFLVAGRVGGCRDDRQVLHVRSLSAWAPQCIGPYSQMNSYNNILLLPAGQIPLIPSKMELADFGSSTNDPQPPSKNHSKSLFYSIFLALRHVHSVVACEGSTVGNSLSCTVYINISRCQREDITYSAQDIKDAVTKFMNYFAEESRKNQTISKSTSLPFSRNIFDVYKDEIDDDDDDDSESDKYEEKGVDDSVSGVRGGVKGGVKGNSLRMITAVTLVPVISLPKDAIAEVECLVLSARFESGRDIIARRFKHSFSSRGTMVYSCNSRSNSNSNNISNSNSNSSSSSSSSSSSNSSSNSSSSMITSNDSNFDNNGNIYHDSRNWPFWSGREIRNLYNKHVIITTGEREEEEVSTLSPERRVLASSKFIVDEEVSSVDRCAFSSSVNVTHKSETCDVDNIVQAERINGSVVSDSASCYWANLSNQKDILSAGMEKKDRAWESLVILSDACRVAGLVIGSRSLDHVVNLDLFSSAMTIRVYYPFGPSLSAASGTNSFEMITSSIKTGFYGGVRSCYLNKSLIDKNILKQLDKLFPLIVIPVVPSMINTNALLFHATCIDIVQFQSEMFIRGF